MKLNPEILDKDAPREFRRFLATSGIDNWEKKIAKVDALQKFPEPCANLYMHYLSGRNPLLGPIKEYLALEQSGKSVWRNFTPTLMRACGSLKVINEIFHHGTETVANKLKSVVLDDETMRSFLFEIDLALNFFGRGYDVQFIDLEGKGTYDLLVSNEEYVLEIECKTKSADAGRKITRGSLYLLWDVLTSRLTPLKQRFALLIRCDGRLSPNQQLYENLAREVKECLESRQEQGKIEELSYTIVRLNPNQRIRNNDEAAKVLAPYWTENAHYFVLSNGATLVVGCESAQRDRVLNSIYEELKRGADQLSKNCPSLLACFIEDIDDEDWIQLTGNTGLANMTHKILSDPERRHVNFVSYSSGRTPPKKEGAITTFPSTNLRFDNVSPKFPIPKSFLGVN